MKETKLVRFNKNDVLCRQGEQGREMYIIRSGKVQIFMKKGDKNIPLTVLGKGSYVGEMSFLAGIPRTATVVAKEPVLASVVTPDVLQNDSLSIEDWAFNIARVLVERIQRTTSILGDYLAHVKDAESNIQPEPAPSAAHAFSYDVSEEKDKGRIFLRGCLNGKYVNNIKEAVRKLKMKGIDSIFLDFSEVIDIDQDGLNYLHEITRRHKENGNGLYIGNVQLIRNKVISIKGIESIIHSKALPQQRVEKDEFLITEGETENTMYVVKTGTFTIFREVDGEKVVLGQAQARDVLGEMTMIKGGKRSANVQATQSSIVYVVELDDFYRNIYNVPKWFIELIKGLIDKLRHTNNMIEAIIKNRRVKENKNRWEKPLGIIVDNTRPGKIIVRGNLVSENLEYMSALINAMIQKEITDISIDLNKVNTIDKQNIVYLLHLYIDLQKRGGKLHILGPHKDIFKLFKQYDVYV